MPREHPRLLGSRDHLATLRDERPEDYARMARVARRGDADDHALMMSLGLVSAIEGDAALGRTAVDMALTYVRGPIRSGHVTFAHDLARCAFVYDLCHEYWTDDERREFVTYLNTTVDANTRSETHVFHNGWYGYKNWGIGLACYATWYENGRAEQILATLEQDWRTRAAPALELAGAGGGWAEGYYTNYWLYEWVVFCEVALRCGGVDYYADAPGFFRSRAVASMFEAYPGVREYGSRRSIPMGDGGGRRFGGDRDKTLSARRILVNHYREDPRSHAVHAFNETTPRSSVGAYAYKDFLWRDPSVPTADPGSVGLSHLSEAAGFVYARSDWTDDATHFYLKAGDRFTAHQHLDVGHFLIYKHEELAGDGGHYDGFGTQHDVNYHLRTIAHSTVLVSDPAEEWPGIRAGDVTGADDGQHHDWPHHNGAVTDPAAWHARRELYDIADIVAFEDSGEYLYVAADCSRAYSADKLAAFTRQVVYLRPDTFVIFDRVESTRAEFRKTWLLQAMKTPERRGESLVVTHGDGRLFVQTLLPRDPNVALHDGDDLYRYGGRAYPPERDTGPAPECRVEVSPREVSTVDYFLHVLTASSAATDDVPAAALAEDGGAFVVAVGDAEARFARDQIGGTLRVGGRERVLSAVIRPTTAPSGR
ncbi:hypothetical protein HN371_01580 [Candidatus Poribacteria bacterium]|nr:hypothetical protein [Candidatus Poribacteria bacterium]MBT7098556.1 hypothetical protein [Candidatus Poribacteria bacterium]